MVVDLLMITRGRWSLWLAMRATITAGMALVAVIVLRSTALPALGREYPADAGPPAPVAWLLAHPQWLIALPLPALVLGVAALVLPPVRGPLAILAALGALLAVLGIVVLLVGALLPMYQVEM